MTQPTKVRTRKGDVIYVELPANDIRKQLRREHKAGRHARLPRPVNPSDVISVDGERFDLTDRTRKDAA